MKRLAVKDDLKVVSLRADWTRSLIKPLMKHSVTRRIVFKVYGIASHKPTLPTDLGTRPTTTYDPLDDTRFVPANVSGFVGSGARPKILRDRVTGALHMFKDATANNLAVVTQGIDSLSQPVRARATSLVARVMGIPTPEIKLVTYRGINGSLQELVPNSIDLSDLRKVNRALFQRVIRSPEFAAQRSDIWWLDRAVGNLDRQSHNILLTLPSDGSSPINWKTVNAEAVDLTTLTLVPIDQDLTCPPVRNFSPIPGVKAYMPRRVRDCSYRVVAQLAADPAPLVGVVADLLTGPEIAAMHARVREAVAVVDATVAERGAPAVFL